MINRIGGINAVNSTYFGNAKCPRRGEGLTRVFKKPESTLAAISQTLRELGDKFDGSGTIEDTITSASERGLNLEDVFSISGQMVGR